MKNAQVKTGFLQKQETEKIHSTFCSFVPNGLVPLRESSSLLSMRLYKVQDLLR